VKGLICYYSGSGNTKLACEAIAAGMKSIDFKLFDVVHNDIPDCAVYDLIGFAAWANYFNPPQLMKTFLESIPRQTNKPAFVFNTFGGFSGRTLATLDGWARARGFLVIAGHSLHTPENYPPMIKRGQDFKNSPNPKELAAFKAFIAQLDELTTSLTAGTPVPARHAGFTRLMPAFARTHSRKKMGSKFVDAEACTECGICRDVCPYIAIILNPKPVFDQNKCYGCWACYNHCPTQAIATKKIRGVVQYSRPTTLAREKLLHQSDGGHS